jgi:hypothetical protein
MWAKMLAALERRDSSIMGLIIAATCLRHGDLRTCEAGCHTYPSVLLRVEDLVHVAENYNLGYKTDQYGQVEVILIPREDNGDHASTKRLS